jgi:hypothetical protein
VNFGGDASDCRAHNQHRIVLAATNTAKYFRIGLEVFQTDIQIGSPSSVLLQSSGYQAPVWARSSREEAQPYKIPAASTIATLRLQIYQSCNPSTTRNCIINNILI